MKFKLQTGDVLQLVDDNHEPIEHFGKVVHELGKPSIFPKSDKTYKLGGFSVIRDGKVIAINKIPHSMILIEESYSINDHIVTDRIARDRQEVFDLNEWFQDLPIQTKRDIKDSFS